jgi:hypothetical protein
MDGSSRKDYLSIELSSAFICVVLNQGTINLWFGRNADKSLVSKVLLIISRVDSAAEHEREALCHFEEISGFENNGYILASYARKKDKYRAVFLVPFSDPRALEKLIDSVCRELQDKEVHMTLSWRGEKARMSMLNQELSKLNCFSFSNITYKDDKSNKSH